MLIDLWSWLTNPTTIAACAAILSAVFGVLSARAVRSATKRSRYAYDRFYAAMADWHVAREREPRKPQEDRSGRDLSGV
jgi:hypothetical protein